MKVLQSSVFRAICAIIVGILLVRYREDTMKWMTIVIGIIFFISGLVSCVVYLYEKKRIEKLSPVIDEHGRIIKGKAPMFPIVGIGSIVLGIILGLIPSDLIIGVTYILAAMLIIGGINQLVSLGMASRYARVPVLFWLFPIITLIVGILVAIHPMEAATLPLQIIGWCLMFYGVVECINAIKIHQMRKAFEKTQEAEIVTGTTFGNDSEDAQIIEPKGIEK
jgi:uncharacterized membrane protein HdeD (DUF308 family)